MRVGVLVDSACDLPFSFIEENNIFVLPLTIRIDGQTIVDDHDPEKTLRLYESGILERGHAAETEAFSTDQIHELLLNQVVTDYDFAFLETITASRSQIFANAWEAMQRTMMSYRPYRQEAGRSGAFSMRVVDSGTFFAGQGLLAAHTVHLINQGIPKAELRRQVSEFRQYIYGALVPRDISYVRKRARSRGDNSISGFAAFLGKALNVNPVIWGQGSEGGVATKSRSFDGAVEQMFDYAANRVSRGVLSPYVVVSVDPTLAGEGFFEIPGVAGLKQACDENDVELLVAEAGITSAIHIGRGSMGVALAAEPHEFDAS